MEKFYDYPQNTKAKAITISAKNLAPIILFVYNRPWHTQQTVEALQNCDLAEVSDLYIFADGPKEDASDETQHKIAEVRQYIHTIDGFKSIHIQESPTNKGLANSIITGISKVIEKHGKVIVIEDDIIVHPFFLRFMNEALDFYQQDKRMYSIGGFNYGFNIPSRYNKDVYIVHRSESHGWGTWLDRWKDVDWNITDANNFFSNEREIKKFNRGGMDMCGMLRRQLNGQIDSWAIRWDYHLYKHNAYCLRPIKTFAKNIGFDGSGVHCGSEPDENYHAELYDLAEYKMHFVKNIKQNHKVANNFHNFWGKEEPVSLSKRTKRLFKRILHSFHVIK